MNIITGKDYFKILLKNFRLSEAIGYIDSQVNMTRLTIDRGNACECLIRDYQRVVCNSMWNNDGLILLSVNRHESELSKDIADERKRLVRIIGDWMRNEKRLILLYVSAYYALVNENRLHLEKYMRKIEEIGSESITYNSSEPIGGYEKIQAIGIAIEKYCNLDDSIFKVIDELAIHISLNNEEPLRLA